MEFNIRGVYKDRLQRELEMYEVIKDTKNQLLLYDKLDESGLVAHNIWYRNANVSKDDQAERIEIIADLTKDFEFQVKTTIYGVIDDKFGEVETEKSMWYVVYKRDEYLLQKHLKNNNVFKLYLALENREDLKLRRDTKYVVRTKGNGYGVDEIINSRFRKIGGISSSCISLDSMLNEVEEEKKNLKR